MQDNKLLKKHLNRLGIIPTICAICILAIGFLLLQRTVMPIDKRNHHTFFSSFLAPDEKITEKKLAQIANTLLRIAPYESLAALDKNHNIAVHYGLPIESDIITRLKATDSTQTFGTKSFIILKTLNDSDFDSVILGFDTKFNSLKILQAVIIILIMGIACILIIVYTTKRLDEIILHPIQEIVSGIREFAQGNFKYQLSLKVPSIYTPLIKEINNLAAQQQRAQEGLQLSIDQATRDLRETLETVEIQNIELDLAKKNAIRESNTKSEFLANTSHELRTPLNGILGFTELLKKTELNDRQLEYLTTIDESAKGLLSNINDILDFSRLETGTLKLEYKPVPIRKSVEEVIALQSAAANEKRLRLLTVIDHGIPENLLGDPLRLKQVLSNLISNAIKYTQTGYVLVSVSCEKAITNQFTLKFKITDSGIGLSKEQQDVLFDAFTKVDSSDSRDHGGTGLGLAIAKGLVDKMNGEIGVDSSPGEGATFWFTCQFGVDKKVQPDNLLTNTLSGYTALVYDHNAMGRMEIIHYARNWGMRTIEAESFDDIDGICQNLAYNQKVIALIDAQADNISVNRDQLHNALDILEHKYSIPSIVLAAPNICRLLEREAKRPHTSYFNRPIIYHKLHNIVCKQLNYSAPLEVIQESRATYSVEKHVRVLAVDDNPSNLKLVNELLKSFTTEITLAESGIDAIERVKETQFDVILMDVQMPEMDGLEATRQIRQLQSGGNRVPIVALTAHAVNEQKTELLLAGMDDFLSKPVGENELRHVVERWTGETLPNLNDTHREEPVQTTTLEKQETLPVFSLTECLRLAKNNRGLAKDMLSMLLASLPQVVQTIDRFYQEQDIIELQEEVHRLHGGSCYCGVSKLKQASEIADNYLQRKIKEKNTHKPINGELDELLTLLKQAIAELEEWNESVDLEVIFE
ncbi:response regulator [Teredinibacter sp. KSP-S5-2]|uniref:response regulator n=1 Tax=Teredinibacter sp. KSP-S5-2 TaxID=3034506 RepID=UPI00293412EB|nr:response regulator [Teredinibacter sp. KSP-S5-2]WNO08008.1 response regulator [Teredinibacter sp. KSP-S5-2]